MGVWCTGSRAGADSRGWSWKNPGSLANDLPCQRAAILGPAANSWAGAARRIHITDSTPADLSGQ